MEKQQQQPRQLQTIDYLPNLQQLKWRIEQMSIKRLPTNGQTPNNLDDFAWENSNVQIVNGMTCYIPKETRDALRIANDVLPMDEFSFLVKCEVMWDEKHVIIEPDMYYPKQKVSSASVEYLEDVAEYNGVIHKHPKSCRNFSGTDKEWINQNFEVSILWIDDEFLTGIINIPSKVGRIQLPLKLQIEDDYLENDEIKKEVELKTSFLRDDEPIRIPISNHPFDNSFRKMSGMFNGNGHQPLLSEDELMNHLSKNNGHHVYEDGMETADDEDIFDLCGECNEGCQCGHIVDDESKKRMCTCEDVEFLIKEDSIDDDVNAHALRDISFNDSNGKNADEKKQIEKVQTEDKFLKQMGF